jgi:hypothetical protein
MKEFKIKIFSQGVVVHAYNLSFSRDGERRIVV